MRAFNLAYGPAAKLSPSVTESRSRKPSRTSGILTPKILSQLVTELGDKNPPLCMSEIPWGHNLVLMHKLKHPLLRLWYARKAIEHGWSRTVLTHQIETSLHRREGKAVTNFKRPLQL
jgi:hypothetical protein